MSLVSERLAERQLIFQRGKRNGATTELESAEDKSPVAEEFLKEGGEKEMLQMCDILTDELNEIYSLVAEQLESA